MKLFSKRTHKNKQLNKQRGNIMLFGNAAADFGRATLQEREAQRKASLNLAGLFSNKKKAKKVK
ncbi:hypothetical protein [Motilimonas pumila]|uniref:hypothetical protein n=1 Tax=Motilimonas pumila TaxID=2303987 RepID=UPI0011C4AC4F|nr:hypothetical protein [Motilimonas pumila]